MAVSARQQAQFWGIGLLVLALMLWLLGSTLLPFLLGAGLAYFLDPIADRLEDLGLSRVIATSVIAITVVLAFAAVLLFAVPALIEQVQGLVVAIPTYIDQLTTVLGRRYPQIFGEHSPLMRNLGEIEATLRDNGMTVLNQILAGSLEVLNFIFLLVVAPVVAFYLLLDWDRMVARVNAILPRAHAPTIRRLAREIDAVLAGFVRGQLTVCLVLGAYYALALMVIGLQFGFLIGMTAGLIAFIPYVGSVVGLTLSVGIALFQFWDEKIWILVTLGVFLFGQFVEGNILQPNLVGKSVGLHPVWLLLALSVFGALFGFAGLLVAVPLAAALGVLGRFLVERYMESPIYTGRAVAPDESIGPTVVPPGDLGPAPDLSVARTVAPDGDIGRAVAPGGDLGRVVAPEGDIGRAVAPDGET